MRPPEPGVDEGQAMVGMNGVRGAVRARRDSGCAAGGGDSEPAVTDSVGVGQANLWYSNVGQCRKKNRDWSVARRVPAVIIVVAGYGLFGGLRIACWRGEVGVEGHRR